MSSGPRRKVLREIKEKLAKQGILEKKAADPMAFLRLSDEEARQQFLHSIIATFLLVLLFIALTMSF